MDESPNYITLPLVEQPQVVIEMIWLDPALLYATTQRNPA
jgi:hypothetical protein